MSTWYGPHQAYVQCGEENHAGNFGLTFNQEIKMLVPALDAWDVVASSVLCSDSNCFHVELNEICD
jgi:hypothetical protein